MIDSDELRLPRHYKAASLADFETHPQAGPIRSLLETKGSESVFLFGPNGVGKTHLACALAHRWCWSHFVNASGVIFWLRSRRRGGEDTERQLLESLGEVSGLIVDDLAIGLEMPMGSLALYHLIDLRANNNRTTIVTSDKSLEEIDRTNSSLASRLACYRRLHLTGPDRRLA